MGNCAGIDWASEKHDVLIEDPAGVELLAATFAHDEDGISALCSALDCFEVEVVAIERPDGLLVDRLLEAGVRVLALHPNQVKAARDRFRSGDQDLHGSVLIPKAAKSARGASKSSLRRRVTSRRPDDRAQLAPHGWPGRRQHEAVKEMIA